MILRIRSIDNLPFHFLRVSAQVTIHSEIGYQLTQQIIAPKLYYHTRPQHFLVHRIRLESLKVPVQLHLEPVSRILVLVIDQIRLILLVHFVHLLNTRTTAERAIKVKENR